MNENILVVDDDKDIRNLIKIYLESEGYNITEAANGKEALNMLDERTFDLIILDIMMPILDGINTCIKIRNSYTMPILFLSAKDDEIDKIQGFEVSIVTTATEDKAGFALLKALGMPFVK